MRVTLDRIATLAIIVAAIAVAAANIGKGFRRPGESYASAASPQVDPELISDAEWAELLATGVTDDDSLSRVVVVEFADLECPFCRRFHEALSQAKSEYGDQLTHLFIHYPLTIHRFARLAAHAAECAATFDRFSPFISGVFAAQDSIGLKPWSAYAIEAGLPDTVSFNHCLQGEPPPRIEEGYQLATRLDVTGTPTVFINRWRLPSPPYSTLPDVIQAILDNDAPYVADRQSNGGGR